MRTGVYLVHSALSAGSVDLVLNTITWHVSPQYYVFFEDKIFTVEHMRKGTLPVNLKKLVEDQLELATQEIYSCKIVQS